jgi:hypothetical protein
MKNTILALFIFFLSSAAYADNYYYQNIPVIPTYPVIQTPIYPSATYSTYAIPRVRYEWVPIYTQRLVTPAPQYGFECFRQPKYATVIEWQFVPITRY